MLQPAKVTFYIKTLYSLTLS